MQLEVLRVEELREDHPGRREVGLPTVRVQFPARVHHVVPLAERVGWLSSRVHA